MTRRIDERQARDVARLARLHLTDEEVARYAEQLSSILEYMDRLQEADTEGVEPTVHPLGPAGALREDEPLTPLRRDAVMDNAPDSEGGHFRVPGVFDRREEDDSGTDPA